jgi:hypothetical protein
VVRRIVVTWFVVWRPVVTWAVRAIPGVVIVEGVVVTIVVRVAPIVVVVWAVVAIGITVTIVRIAVAVVGIAVAIVDVRATPTAKHCGNIARLYPHLIAHNHNGIEGGVVGQSEEVGVAIAVVVVRRRHLVRGRREAPQTTLVGTLIIIYIDVVVGVIVVDDNTARRDSIGHCRVVEIQIAQKVVDIGLGIGGSYHSVDSPFALGCFGGLLFGQGTLGSGNGCTVVGAVEVVAICCGVAGGGAPNREGYTRGKRYRQRCYKC